MAADLTVQRGPFKGRPHQWFTRQEVERLTGALSDVDPVTLEVWRMQGRTVGAMLAEAQAAVIEAHEALHLIANTTTDRGAREEAQRALGVATDQPEQPQ